MNKIKEGHRGKSRGKPWNEEGRTVYNRERVMSQGMEPHSKDWDKGQLSETRDPKNKYEGVNPSQWSLA